MRWFEDYIYPDGLKAYLKMCVAAFVGGLAGVVVLLVVFVVIHALLI